MSLLIVNADDYGLTEGTSRAILECHRDGIVTSTSLLTLAPGFEGTVGWLADHPDLGVGIHLALVGEDRPLLGAAEIPSLVDAGGRLPASWREFVRRALLGRIDVADVERELGAQVDRVLGAGVPVTHLDAHQHLHQWPTVWPVVRRLAARAGVGAVRTTASRRLRPLQVLGRWTAWRARAVGLRTTDAFAGFEQSGALSEPALLEVVGGLPPVPSVELGCHPGARHDPDRARYDWGFRWPDEAEALCSPAVRDAVARRGFRLGHFGDLR
jgi:predicted glycoside hydrolase/deacetylase ChbG (UPF0249 family)